MTGMAVGTVGAAVHSAVPEAINKPVAGPAPELPAPAAAWTDATTAVLAALAEFFKETREGMREVKKSFDAARREQMAEEVASMRAGAKEIRNGAVMQGVTLAVSAHWGAMAVTTSDQALAEKYKWAAGSWGKADGIVDGIYKSRAKDCEADAAAARATAEHAKTDGEDIRELADGQAELASKAMEAIRSILEARHAATMSILMQKA